MPSELASKESKAKKGTRNNTAELLAKAITGRPRQVGVAGNVKMLQGHVR